MGAYQLLSALALFQLSTNSVGAAPVTSCVDQQPCLDISVTQSNTAECGLSGSCSFEACVTLDTGAQGCDKNGDSLSHLCDQSDADSCPRGDIDGGVWDTIEQTNVIVNTQCQIGAPGDSLRFVYKDGNGCSQGVTDPTSSQIDVFTTDDGYGTVDCSANEELTCTGQGNLGRECIWTVKLPDQCDDVMGPTCPTVDDFSLSADLADGAFCLADDATLFDITIESVNDLDLPSGTTVDYEIQEGTVVIAGGMLQRLIEDAELLAFEDYFISLYFTLGDGQQCDPIMIEFSPECDCDFNTDNCPGDLICCITRNICDEYNPNYDDANACGDPHMTGFLGQKFDFTGQDGGWYSLIADANMHINMRVTSPVPDLPEITYITGLSVLTTDADGSDHSIVVEVKDPHDLDSSCPAGVSPCLADGSLRVLLDGEEQLLKPGTVSLSKDVQVSAANLPGACRSFGFEKYWERKQLENARNGRRLGGKPLRMGEWILADPTATNMDECIEYVTRAEVGEGGPFAHQSEHASFQIVTPQATIRLSHGRLHQIAVRDPTDHYDLPDHLTWQMNMAVDHTDVNRDAKGILGETFVPTRDATGKPIMTGMNAIRGTQEDYRVDGALETDFVQAAHTN